MIADILLLIIALIALIFSTVVDIKIKEVPNWISYSLIISAISIRIIAGLATENYFYFIYGLIALIVSYIIAYSLYHLQIWGGGDSKLLIGLSCVFATKPFFLETQFPFILLLFFCIALAGATYSVIIATYLGIKHKSQLVIELKKIWLDKKINLIRRITSLSAIILVTISFFFQNQIKIFLMITSIFVFFYIFLWMFIKSIEKVSMYKLTAVSKLTEGDWLVKDVTLNNEIICKKHANGLTHEDIQKLKQHNITEVKIKHGIPFVPPFLIGLIIVIIWCLV